MTTRKKPATKGRPKGSKRPGSRPDLQAKPVTAVPIVETVEGEIDLSDFRQIKKRAFLQAFGISGTKYHACQSAKVSRETIDIWLKEDPEFRTAFKNALDDSMDMIEHSFKVRTVLGVKKTIYYKGQPIGEEVHHSDVAGIVLLKAYRPERYRERYELTGAGGGPIEVANPVQRLMSKLLEIRARTEGLLDPLPDVKPKTK